MSKLLLPPAKHSVYYLSWDTFNDIIPLFAFVNRTQKSSLPKSSHFSLLINLVLIKFRVSSLNNLSYLELIIRAYTWKILNSETFRGILKMLNKFMVFFGWKFNTLILNRSNATDFSEKSLPTANCIEMINNSNWVLWCLLSQIHIWMAIN